MCGVVVCRDCGVLIMTMAVVLYVGPFFGGHLRPGEGTKGRTTMLSNMRYGPGLLNLQLKYMIVLPWCQSCGVMLCQT